MTTQNFIRSILLVSSAIVYPAVSHAGFLEVNAGIGAPPPLPAYEQPACPSSGFMWTPGYWSYDGYAQDYFWVPGAWVEAPALGLLWTPGYWDESNAGYLWHDGYWASDVGFYGGIDYGFGYLGSGFVGGYWHGRDFFYNRAVANVSNLSIRNVYNTTIVNDHGAQHISFNGPHGIHARPSGVDLRAQRESHRGFTESQRRHAEDARRAPALSASANRARSAVATTSRPVSYTRPVATQTTSMRADHGYARPASPKLIAAQVRTQPARMMPQPLRRAAPAPVSARSVPAPRRVETARPDSRPSAAPRVAYHPAAPSHMGSTDPHHKGRPA